MRAGWCVAAVLGAVGWAGLARADAILSGTYSGIGTEQIFAQTAPGITQTLTGVPVTGSFFVDATGCFPFQIQRDSCSTSARNLVITAQTPQESGMFSQPLGLITVENGTGRQTLGLTGGYTNPYVQATLTLSGGADGFVQGTDFQSLSAGAVDLAGSSLAVYGGREYQIAVTLTSVVFNSVPEPASLPLLGGMAAFAVVAGFSRLHRS